tara:strand:- start:1808 stop:2521 length:714 start_codon:yes stop_codon:yes gene_type:complete
MEIITCKNCDKKYKNEKAYEKHRLLCLDDEDNLEDRPLKELVIRLIADNRKLRHDVNELKRWVESKKKKIRVIEYLNEKYTSEITYTNFLEKINIDRSDLELVFAKNIVDSFVEIIQKQLQQISNQAVDNINPFLSFIQKKNLIYKYENSKWSILTLEEFDKIVTKIYSSILKQFKIWQDENQQKIFNNSDFSDLYTKYVKKIVGNIPINEQKNKIFNNFYKSIKLDLQNTIEYEFS